MPRIIDDETWEKVQRRFEENKRIGRQASRGTDEDGTPRFWLTGHLTCGVCGSTLCGTHGRSKTGRNYYYYACVNHIRRRKGKCAKRSVRKEKLEGVVTDVLTSLLNDQELLASFAVDVASYYRSTHDDGAYLRSPQSELDDAERSIRNLVAAIERGALSDALLRRLEDTEQRAGLLRETIAAEEAKQSLVEDEYTIAALFEKFANANLGDAEVRDNVLRYFVDEIIVSDNRIDIVVDWLDYVGDTRFERTFTFGDVKTRFVPLREFEPSRDGRGGGTRTRKPCGGGF